MKEAGYCCEMEKLRLDAEDGKKPADVFVDSLVDNKPTAVDIAITSPIQQVIVQKANKQILDAAQRLTDAKFRKYENMINKGHIVYIPLMYVKRSEDWQSMQS